jgi:2-amino-4-hydroxy-6-hydroxymethyldihydropteridine diphosphokinase
MADPISNAAYLALGSNVQPERNLPAAVRLLSEIGTIERVSQVWESPPADGSNQPHYLNAALLLRTPLDARTLKLKSLAGIEARLGRVRRPGDRYAPRTIDIDIALFNCDVLTVEHRHIPDPEIAQRPFLAWPLSEIAPDYQHPVLNRSLAQIAADLGGASALTPRSDVCLTYPAAEAK